MSETASLLAEHWELGGSTLSGFMCECGERLARSDDPYAEHRAHVAAVLDAHFAERERAARNEGWGLGFKHSHAATARPATEGEGA